MIRETLITAAALLGASSADATVFDFETIETGRYSAVQQTVDGLTISVSRMGGFDTSVDDTEFGPDGFGRRSLSLFADTRYSPFVVNSSTGLTSFSVEIGDFAPSDTDEVFATAYSGVNGTGTTLASIRFGIDGFTGFPDFSTLSLSSAVPFLSVVFNGGSSEAPSSIYADNISVTATSAVPEPSTWIAMILGMAGIGGAMRFGSGRRVKYPAITR